MSRKHVQLEVDEATGTVSLASIGREPVSVNGEPVECPVELCGGDVIEVSIRSRSCPAEKAQKQTD